MLVLLNMWQFAAPAATVEVARCREAINKLASEAWCALLSPNSGAQARTRLDHLLRLAVKKEYLFIPSMMEVLILNYAQKHGLKAGAQSMEGTKKKKVSDGTH